MRRLIRPDAMTRLRLRAHERGATLKVVEDFDPRSGGSPLGTSQWNASGNCSNPVTVELWTRPELRTEKTQVCNSRGHRVNMDMEVRCRKCANCLKARAAHWRFRARAEWTASPRTWLVTLTFSPEAQFRALSQARLKYSGSPSFEQLSEDERFAALERETGREVTLFLKRLRKGGPKVRYLLVAEAHKSGKPHYHMLVHEVLGDAPIRHAAIKRAWSSGYLDAKLVTDERAATYATKYLTKSSRARVRASFRYGYEVIPPERHSREAVEREKGHFGSGTSAVGDAPTAPIHVSGSAAKDQTKPEDFAEGFTKVGVQITGDV